MQLLCRPISCIVTNVTMMRSKVVWLVKVICRSTKQRVVGGIIILSVTIALVVNYVVLE